MENSLSNDSREFGSFLHWFVCASLIPVGNCWKMADSLPYFRLFTPSLRAMPLQHSTIPLGGPRHALRIAGCLSCTLDSQQPLSETNDKIIISNSKDTNTYKNIWKHNYVIDTNCALEPFTVSSRASLLHHPTFIDQTKIRSTSFLANVWQFKYLASTFATLLKIPTYSFQQHQ